jgi:hypothetical protein
MRLPAVPFIALTLFCVSAGQAARPRLSDDRELKEIDLSHWDCMNKLEGTAKTPEQMERNRLKNRSMPEGPIPATAPLDFATFLQRIAEFEGKTKNRKRNEVAGAPKQILDPLEKQIVTLTGYLGLAYPGPPESTNCGSGDFHDWHLEIYEKPLAHAPQPGDTTPIICEITPRTQSAVFRAGIRIQELTEYFRRSDMTYEATGHKPQKIRLTGYLLWDDEHNGTADVGTTIQNVTPNKYHHPWRQAAWEIHPVLKIERADGAASSSAAPPSEAVVATPAPEGSVAPAEEGAAPPAPTAAPAPTVAQLVTLLIPLRIPTTSGETVIPRGTRLPVLSRDAQSVTVNYMGQSVIILNGYIERR